MKLKNQLLIQTKSLLHWLHEYHVEHNFVMSETGHGSCFLKILHYNWLGDCLMEVQNTKNGPLGNFFNGDHICLIEVNLILL